jgi:putative ABC transport system permease protein
MKVEGAMLRNYLKVVARDFARHKVYSLINLFGLVIGMTCCILILLWVANELSFDRYHDNADHIYRLYHYLNIGGHERHAPMTSPPMAPAIIQDFPEVVNAVRLSPENRMSVEYKDNRFYEDEIRYADNSIFEVFSFSILKGNVKTALLAPYSVVITEEIAEKYFSGEDPIGKTLRFNSANDYTVKGVIKHVPQNSHFTFDMLCSFETLYAEDRPGMDVWGWLGYYTYLQLPEGSNYKELEEKFPNLVETYSGERLRAIGGTLELYLQPLTSIHLFSNLQSDLTGGGDIFHVYFFSGVALFILLIACFNFINLTTARSVTRAKEVAIKKIFGARRGNLVKQFWIESITYCLLGVLLAGLIVELVLPFFNSLTGQQLNTEYLRSPWTLLGIAIFAIFVGIVAGGYPSFYLSAFRPIKILSGDLSIGSSKSLFRSLLVIMQFVISIALIFGTLLIYKQLKFMKNKELGFNKEHVIILPDVSESSQLGFNSLIKELLEIQGVQAVAASSGVPGRGGMMATFLPEGFAENEAQMMRLMDADDKFISTLDMEIIAGRNFSEDIVTDSAEAAIINEIAAKQLGWDNPIGKTIKRRIPGPGNTADWSPKTVIGVVKDFHLSSLHMEIEPLFIGNELENLNTVSIRISPYDVNGTLDLIKQKWNEITPNLPFDYLFLDESFDSLYQSEESLQDITFYFSFLAIFLGCLGLYGLSSFATEQRTKEIGIRKVLGASIPSIIRLLSKKFIILVVISIIIACPISYYIMNRWLENYPYRINIGFDIFVYSGVLALLTAIIAVNYRVIKSALNNPVDSLRNE